MTLPNTRTVLIHAQDPLVAALLGAMLDEEAIVLFPEPGETLASAAARLKPRAILADVAFSGTERVILFGSAEACRAHRAAGRRCLAMPADRAALHSEVRRLLETP